MIWEEMSYNKMIDCFSFVKDLEYSDLHSRKIQTKKVKAEQPQKENIKETKE